MLRRLQSGVKAFAVRHCVARTSLIGNTAAASVFLAAVLTVPVLTGAADKFALRAKLIELAIGKDLKAAQVYFLKPMSDRELYLETWLNDQLGGDFVEIAGQEASLLKLIRTDRTKRKERCSECNRALMDDRGRCPLCQPVDQFPN